MKIIRNIEGRSHLTASQVRARARVVMLTSRSATAVSPAFFSARAGRPPARRVAMASSATSTPAPTIRLSSGNDMPLVGLGTWQAPRGVVGAATSTAAGAVGFAARIVEGVEATVGGVQDGVAEALLPTDAAALAAAKPRRAPLAAVSYTHLTLPTILLV